MDKMPYSKYIREKYSIEEAMVVEIETSTKNHLQRKLTNRHLQMIALGGAIGTGLFYGSASTIAITGPAIILSYLVGGIIMFLIMRMLGEICVEHPISGSFSAYAEEFWGQFPAYLSGWSYLTAWILTSMAELTAIGIYINFWFPGVPQWVTALVCLIAVTIANLINVRMYGELETFMSGVKVLAVIAMIVFGLYLLFTTPSYSPFPDNFSNIWTNGGFIPHGWYGVACSMAVVLFSFAGVELIGMTAAEVQEPEKHMPTAINQVLVRVMIFYVGTMIVLMALFPWDKIGASGSPFVEIFAKMGINVAAHILNFVVLIAAISVYNSGMYANGRMLYSLARKGKAPKALRHLSKTGIPTTGILFSSGMTFIAVLLNYIMPEKVFNYLMALGVVVFIVCWATIVITHLKFRQMHEKQGTVDAIKFKSILYPYANYLCIAFFIVVLAVMATMESMQPAVLLLPIWLIIMAVSYKMTHKTVTVTTNETATNEVK